MSLRRALYLCNTKREKERKREWDRRTNGQRGAGTDRRTDERARKVRQSRLYGHAFESLHLSTRSFHLYLSASAPNFFLNTNLTISWRQVSPDLPRSAQVLLQLQVRLPTLSCPSSLPPITYICLRSTTNTFFRRFDKHVFVETIKSWKKYTRIQDERQKESLLQQVLKKVVVVWAPFSFSGELRPPPFPPPSLLPENSVPHWKKFEPNIRYKRFSPKQAVAGGRVEDCVKCRKSKNGFFTGCIFAQKYWIIKLELNCETSEY